MAGNHGQWFRFLISGGIGFIIFYGLALLFRWLTPWTDGVCAFVGTLLAIPPTFLLQRTFTFKSSGRLGTQATGYLFLQLSSSAIIGSSAYLADKAGIPASIGFIIAGVTGVLFSYLIQAFLVFKKN